MLLNGEVGVYVGSSAGSFTAALAASGFTVEELYSSLSENYSNKHSNILKPISYKDVLGSNLKSNINSFFNSFKRIINNKEFSIESILQTIFGFNGLFSTKNVGKYLKNVLPSDCFKDLASELYIVTTELNNINRIILGPKELKTREQATYVTDVPISEAAIASMSLPFIFGPYKLKIDGTYVDVFDGEVRHTLSSHIAKDAGCDLIISSYTHQPYTYSPEYGSLINYGLPIILVQTIYLLIESKIREAKIRREIKAGAIDEVRKFFIENNLPKNLMNELIENMQKRMQFNENIDYIWIAPEPHDATMFFEDHFNLSLRSMGRIIKSGFKSAYHALSEYKFEFIDTNSQEVLAK
ncbi:MAG: hypothetical protein KatS3mg068_0815 [Candidatus Sericytochromatia bacterium]|nr:MAG: hypothetical protein KatS3mg068_0815 [Candidatus Sericytochromatia bacterium]